MSELDEYDVPPARPSRSRRDSILGWVVLIVALGGVALLAVPVVHLWGGGMRAKSPQTKGINNPRQILLALKLYVADNQGIYPDGSLERFENSNIVYDILLEEGIVTSEAIFGSPNSIFNPDGDLTTSLASESEAVHWALATGRSDSSDGGSAVVFENSGAMSGVGSPDWGPPGNKERGRSWSGPRITIATNDGAVQTYALLPPYYKIDGVKNPDPFVRHSTFQFDRTKTPSSCPSR